MEYVIIAAVVLVVALLVVTALFVVGLRVLVAAHSRPPGAARVHGDEASHSHTGSQRLVLGTLTGPIRLAMRLGIRIGPMMMLTVRGRTSGIPRTTPVDVFERGGRRWLVATHTAEANWVRNLRAAREGSLARGRRSFGFTAVELPQEEAGAILKEVLGPRLARPVAGVVLRQTLGVPHDAPLEEFVRAAALHPVFEITGSRGLRAAVTRGHRTTRWPVLAIVGGLLVVGSTSAFGVVGVFTSAQWAAGVAFGLLLAGAGNHVRIFGRR